jgi:molybdopterin/thiamine biosynthesis adenylyltransferase
VTFTDAQMRRYSRHILLPTVGGHGQARLLAATVVIDVDGQAGRVAALLLGAAGVGRIELVGALDRRLDDDDLGFPFTAADRGQPIATALAAQLVARNPDVTVAHAADARDPLRIDGDHPRLPLAQALALGGAVAAARALALATGGPP